MIPQCTLWEFDLCIYSQTQKYIFFSMKMNIYTINIKTTEQQSPDTMTVMAARDPKKVITKCKN